MSSKRSNKTARVLNLIAKSDNETSDTQSNAQEVLNSNNNMSEDTIADSLTKHNEEQTEEEIKEFKPTSDQQTNSVLLDDTINNQENEQETTETQQIDSEEEQEGSTGLPPAPQPVVPILQNVREQESQLEDQIYSELLSNLEVEEQAEPKNDSEHTSEPAKGSNSNAVLSDDAISALFAQNEQAKTENTPEPAPEPAKESNSNAVLSDDAISALFAQNEQAKTENTPEPAPEPTKESNSNEVLSDDAISALFAQNDQEPTNDKNNPKPEKNETKSNLKTEDNNFFSAAHGKRSVTYINVLQELVEEEAEYSSQMLACRCPRCIADMKALTLTNLPSKYVVVEENQKKGILRIYMSKYSRLISTQIMKSCVIVNENPHH